MEAQPPGRLLLPDLEFFVGRHLFHRVFVKTLVQLQVAANQECPRAPRQDQSQRIHITQSAREEWFSPKGCQPRLILRP